MKYQLLFATLTLALAANSTVIASEALNKAPPVRVLKVALNLEDEQVTALRELIEARTEEVKGINAEVHELQQQLEALVKTEDPDEAEVGRLVLDVRALKQEIGQGHELYQNDFRELLTAMQLERLARINHIAVANRAAEVLGKLRLH